MEQLVFTDSISTMACVVQEEPVLWLAATGQPCPYSSQIVVAEKAVDWLDTIFDFANVHVLCVFL